MSIWGSRCAANRRGRAQGDFDPTGEGHGGSWTSQSYTRHAAAVERHVTEVYHHCPKLSPGCPAQWGMESKAEISPMEAAFHPNQGLWPTENSTPMHWKKGVDQVGRMQYVLLKCSSALRPASGVQCTALINWAAVRPRYTGEREKKTDGVAGRRGAN
jgi:hypothetical protein